MSDGTTRLYELLPAVYRQRDAEQSGVLRALLATIEGELRLVERDIAGLYDNWFVETCEEWVVPYIGDLLNVRGLLPVREGGALGQRAAVANTLAYRRRKGTAAVLEQLARDVTGWPAAAVEFFERLATTQHANHPRAGNLGTVDVRDADALELVGGPFERAARSADVRHIDVGRGRHNIPNVGLFLWRLQPYAVERGEARAVADPPDGRYAVSPLGTDAPLFGRPQTEREIVQLAREENVPGPLRRRALHDELEERRQALVDGRSPSPRFFGPNPVFEVLLPRPQPPNSPPIPAVARMERVPPEFVMVCDLSDPAGEAPAAGWRRPPSVRQYRRTGAPADESAVAREIRVAVDPVAGRIAFPAGTVPERVEISHAYGFPGDLGGGPYDRRASVADWLPTGDRRPIWQVGVADGTPAGAGPVGVRSDGPGGRELVGTLAEAVQGWNTVQADGIDRIGLIAVTDSATYREALTGAQRVRVPAGSMLAIVAAGWPEPRVPGRLSPVGVRPHLLGNVEVEGLMPGADEPDIAGGLVLDGLLVEGGITILAGNLGSLRLAHCTLVPGRGLDARGEAQEPERPSLVVAPPDPATGAGGNDRLLVRIERSITGPLRLPARLPGLEVIESIVDSPTRGGRASAHPALVSGPFSSFQRPSDNPSVLVTIGNQGPFEVVLAGLPTEDATNTIAEARDALQLGLQGLGFQLLGLGLLEAAVAFLRARVITQPAVDRLIVLPGLPGRVVIEPSGTDPTATLLRLDPAQARRTDALVGGRVTLPLPDDAPPPLLVTIGNENPRLVALSEAPSSAAQARDALHAAIRAAAGGSDAFAQAIVANLEDRLVIVPGLADVAVLVAAPPGARAGLLALALESDRPAIAENDGGNLPGPATTIERSTLFGPVNVAALTASETLFTAPLLVERRQTGCVRFSYVPPGARTPRRFRCQPDRELADRLAEAERRATAAKRRLSDDERDAIRLAVERSVVPVFASSRYGRPAYAQLAATCAEAIRSGAEDEGEIGAFHFLQQPQRLTNLRSSLDEYLRFGLEAGVILVT